MTTTTPQTGHSDNLKIERIMNEVKTIRCKIDKGPSFDKLSERLDEELEQNVADGTIRLTQDRDGTITSRSVNAQILGPCKEADPSWKTRN
jgi:hypothetical protein